LVGFDVGLLVGFEVGGTLGFLVGEKVGSGVAPPATVKMISSTSSYPEEGHVNGFEVLAFPFHRNTTLTA
jgi:hypothetical protein